MPDTVLSTWGVFSYVQKQCDKMERFWHQADCGLNLGSITDHLYDLG